MLLTRFLPARSQAGAPGRPARCGEEALGLSVSFSPGPCGLWASLRCGWWAWPLPRCPEPRGTRRNLGLDSVVQEWLVAPRLVPASPGVLMVEAAQCVRDRRACGTASVPAPCWDLWSSGKKETCKVKLPWSSFWFQVPSEDPRWQRRPQHASVLILYKIQRETRK